MRGVGVLLGRLAYQGWRLHRATRHLPREARPGYTLAYTGGRLPTSSFGRTVFWDETAGLTPAEAAPVLAHELAHVRQGHSYDVLWLEIWRAALWPNPFAHLLLPALRLTHELLADQAAAHSPTPPHPPMPPCPTPLCWPDWPCAARRAAATSLCFSRLLFPSR
ncbi:MAG: M48 family metalloprotease [Hymenobacter sp.]